MPDLLLPMRLWSATQRRLALAGSLLLTTAVAIWMAIRVDRIFEQADVPFYLLSARGLPSRLPFASRQLGPLIVRGLAHLLHLSVEHAFFAEGTAALLVVLATVFYLLTESGAPGWMLPAVAGTYLWVQMYNGLALPDLFYSALLCVFLLLLRSERFLLAAVWLFPLMVARESTLVTLACFLLAGGRRLRVPVVAVALLSVFAGTAVVKHLAANALPNVEGISPTLYLFAKMPWNFLKNFLGLIPWANVYQSCPVPEWQRTVHLGPLKAIGYCGWSWKYPVWLLTEALVSFGLLPLLLWRVWGARLPEDAAGPQWMLRFCLLYGGLLFVLTGVDGEAFGRLFGYSWPLFLVALPILAGAGRGNFRSAWAAAVFLVVHWMLTWLNLGMGEPLLLIPALLLFLAGWLVLRTGWLPDTALAPPV